MTAEIQDLIAAYDEYLKVVAESECALLGVACAHGFSIPDGLVAKGKEMRSKIETLKWRIGVRSYDIIRRDDLRFDPSRFRKDVGARSLSYYSLDPTVGVDDRLVDTLIAESERNGGVNARVCLHTSPESNFHEMIILERQGYYFPPHRHTNKAQSCNILRGEAAVFVFDDAGNVKRTCVLGRDGNLIFRIGEERFHLTIPLTPFIVYHEGKPGPFEREGDSIYAEWAPKREDKQAVADYMANLVRLVG